MRLTNRNNRRRTLTQYLPALLLLPAMLLTCARVSGQEFKIETQVYLNGDNQPVSSNMTLFSEGLIFDYQMSAESPTTPVEIAIYDTTKQSFAIIDCQREIRLELEQHDLVRFVESLRQQTSQNELSSFLVNDPFDEQIDVSTGIVSLDSPIISYQLVGKRPDDASILPMYFQFIDQFTQLGASDPRKLPPFPRMQLNQAIKKYGWLPETIHVTLRPNPMFSEQVQLKSRHTFITALSAEDRQKISETKTRWMAAEKVSLGEFRGFQQTQAVEQDK